MSTHDRRTDEELVEDYLEGDVPSFRALIDRYHDPLMRFLYRLMGDRAAAEDVFQETFLQIHQSLAGFDCSRRFKPWAFTIAANKGRDALRRRQRRQAVSLSAPMDASGERSFVDVMEIDTPEVGAGLDREELSEMVQHAVDTLSPRLREILLLAYFQRFSYAQISDALGIPVGTVKSRLHAAVAAFAKAWKAESEGRDAEPGSEKPGGQKTRDAGEHA